MNAQDDQARHDLQTYEHVYAYDLHQYVLTIDPTYSSKFKEGSKQEAKLGEVPIGQLEEIDAALEHNPNILSV